MNEEESEPLKNNSSKIDSSTNYLPYSLLKEIITTSEIPKKIIEESNSELWYETLTGKGKINFINHIKYNGPIENGILETKNDEICTIIFKNGTKYIGEIHNNKITGKGKYIFPSGAFYSGNLLNGFRNGFGKYYSNEISYEGNWKNGLKNGIGKMINKNMIYEGNWINGNINGYGKIKWNNGNLYEGYFNNNIIDGNGYMIWFNLLEKYIGNWKNNLQNGFGIHIYFENKGEIKLLRNRYIGEYLNGIRNGFGIFFYSNGSVYEGEWENNMKNGFGVFLFEDGKKYFGRFENDKMIDLDNQLNNDLCDKLYENYLIMKENILNLEREKRAKLEKDEDKKRKLQLNSIKGSNKKMSVFDIRIDKKNSLFEKKNYSERRIIKTKESEKKSLFGENKNLTNTNTNTNRNYEINNNETNNEKTEKTENNILNEYKENIKEIKKKYLIPEETKIKSLNRYEPYLDINDIILLDETIKENEKEIRNVLLRQLSDIKRLYLITLKIASGEIKEVDDFNSSKLLEKNPIRKPSKNIIGSNIGQNFIIEENPKSNDISFCISIKDIWVLFRENGIFNFDLSISDFNKFYFNNENNFYNTYQIPDQIKEHSKIYDYMKVILNEAKVNFFYKYKSFIKYYHREKGIPSTFDNLNYKEKTEHSIHFKNHIILPRFFNECLVRVAYLKYYNNNNIPLSVKLKNILDFIIPQKKKNMKRGSISKLEMSFENNQYSDSKNKIYERNLINEFIFNFYSPVQKLFKNIYYLYSDYPSQIDQTVSYRFFYYNIIKKSSLLNKLYPNKISFIELIQYFFKNKVNFSEEKIKEDIENNYIFIEKILENEFIEYEFFEMIYLISKKYFEIKKIKNHKEDYLNLINKIEEVVNLNKKKKKLKKIYYFPVLENHNIKIRLIEKLKKESEEREKKMKEIERYTKERKRLEREDENIFYEEIESNESSENYD